MGAGWLSYSRPSRSFSVRDLNGRMEEGSAQNPRIDSVRISHFTFSIFHLLWRSLREEDVSRGGRGDRGGGGVVGAFLCPQMSRIVRIGLRGGVSKILPRNTRKPASRDAEGSLKNAPSDLILAILPLQMGFGREADGRAKRKLPIAFRVRRSRFPCVPWFDSPMRVGGTAGLVGGY